MSSTNHTTNYGLSQFLGTDKPAWLVDYNGDMAAIDTQMKANADAASGAQTTANTADGKADANASAITTLDTQINGASGIATDVTTLQGSVNSITSLIGNGEPTTTDKTLIGAINELDSSKADSNNININPGFYEYTIDTPTTTTLGTALDNSRTAFLQYIDNLTDNRFALDSIELGGYGVLPVDVFRYEDKTGFENSDHDASFVDVEPDLIARTRIHMPATGSCGVSLISFDGSQFSGGDITSEPCSYIHTSAIRFRFTVFDK